MNEIIFHIGPHKTGSTYIQKTLFENVGLLKENKIIYPSEWVGPQWGHHKVVEFIVKRDLEKLEKVFSEVEGALFLSSENFDRLNVDDLEFLDEFLNNVFKDRVVKIIFFKRSYEDVLLSSWQEDIKHGGGEAWSQYFLRHLARPFKSDLLYPIKILEAWIKIIRPQDVFIVDYDLELGRNKDIAEVCIERVFEKKIELTMSRARVNASLNYMDVEIIRCLNKIYSMDFTKGAGVIVRDYYLQQLKNKNELVLNLKLRLKSFCEDFSLSDSWSINTLEKMFYDKYGLGIANFECKNRMMPSDDWLLDLDNIKLLYDIYDSFKNTLRVTK